MLSSEKIIPSTTMSMHKVVTMMNASTYSSKLNIFQKLFFEMRPTSELTCTINDMDDEFKNYVCTIEGQTELVRQTVCSPHARIFPPSKECIKKFLRNVIEMIEKCNFSICDELYEAFGQLFHQDTNANGIIGSFPPYKTYFVFGKMITVAEDGSFVKGGTTGLQMWDAGKILTQWCLENKAAFHEKVVFEVGSGVGLTGICICAFCRPRKYVFSDCHPQVLNILHGNATLNLGINNSSENADCGCNSCRNISHCLNEFNGHSCNVNDDVSIMEFDVLNNSNHGFKLHFKPDVILVAGEESLSLEDIPVKTNSWFHLTYNTVPIKLFKIFLQNKS